ncbi:MAG: tetratricopeptide repeat protein [Ignavibacterium sp.]|jgi:tetratricopeptide (TPR) repeat protein
MKSPIILAAFLAAFLLFQGFQCASSEFTGAKLHIQQNNYPEAKRLLEIEVQKNPQNEEAWYLLGWVSGEAGEYESMNAAYGKALELSPRFAKDIRANRYNRWAQTLNRGLQYLERASPESTSFYESALGEFDKAVRIWPDTSLTYRYIGYAYYNSGRSDKALEAFTTAWEKGKDIESLKPAVRLYIERGDQLKTRFESENADKLKAAENLASIRKNTRRSDVIDKLGAPDRIKRGPRNSKKEDLEYRRFNLTVSIENDRVTAKNFSKPYVPDIDSTNQRLAMREYDQAIRLLTEAKDAGMSDAETLNMFLRAYIQSNRIGEAVTEYERVVSGDPTNKDNLYVLGVLYRSSGNYQKAVDSFSKAYKVDPEFTDALFDLGATYYNWGVDLMRAAEEKGDATNQHKEKFKDALPYIEEVSKRRPDDVQVWETLGTIYAQLGRQDDALKAFDRADELKAK